jgi:hypothetical protein
VQERRSQATLPQSKPNGQGCVPVHDWGWHRGWALLSQTWPSGQVELQPGVQADALSQEQATGAQMSPLAQSVSTVQVLGPTWQIGQPGLAPGARQNVPADGLQSFCWPQHCGDRHWT